ncbi:MAG TPA: hypothetical protein VHR72_04410 [Gemmataceae bacterium]|nr:hypothetical protein [Gemmataceae bacterium]
MRTVQVWQKTGDDGELSLRISVGEPNAEFDVLVVLQPKSNQNERDEKGWPPGFIDATYGSIDDDTFCRPPQGELPKSIEID